MKNHPTLKEQISKLTDKQKINIIKIFKFQTAISIILIFALLIPILCFHIEAMLADKAYNEAIAELEEKPYNYELMGRRSFAQARYNKMIDMRNGYGIIGGVVVLLICIFILIFIRIKFPYYSDRRYVYIRKMQQKNKHQKKNTGRQTH